MTDKEIREIRRRFRPDKNNIISLKGCMVNSEKTIISQFSQSVAQCSTDESEKILAVMKKSLSGSLGTNLLDLEYGAMEVSASEKHKMLMALRDSHLKDDELLTKFYETVIESVSFEGNFAILLIHDTYDVFEYSDDGEKDMDSSSQFSYIVCSICPVKELNTGLYFREYDGTFRTFDKYSVLSNPDIGFMFPSFDNRAANIYNVLYYTRDISDVHPEFVDNIFGVEIPVSAAEKKDSLNSCLKETLEEECDFNVMRSVHDHVSVMVQEHKATKQEEPLKLSKKTFREVLEDCGVNEERVERFSDKFDEEFGEGAEIAPKSIIDVKKFQLVTPDVQIKVNPDRTDLVTTQVIDGVRYIMIRANTGVEVNGVNIDIK
ncbi:MAG: DUF4317 family protein [Ruminococcaceae bacterium]|nr:DUF4317 family protein [Oscillospiraceae bacterium]